MVLPLLDSSPGVRKQALRRWAVAALALCLADPAAAAPAASAVLSQTRGRVEVQRKSMDLWTRAQAPYALHVGDKVRTKGRGQAMITFQDGSRVEIGPKAELEIEAASTVGKKLKLGIGKIKAWVQKAEGQRFDVKTPKAVASVRGTEFSVDVNRFGNTVVDLYSGLLGVSDTKGNETLMQPNQRVTVDNNGLGKAQSLSGSNQRQDQDRKQQLRSQVALGMGRDAVMAAAAEEMKLAEYQQGKTLIDVNGNRVRLQQYILRPRDDQFKLVVLNDRDSRFDYFFYQGTFNKTLPEDLSLALKTMNGGPVLPEWYMTSYATGRSNTVDTIAELASGGHPVDVNNNAVSSDNVSAYFDADLNRYVNVSGSSYYKVLYDNYSIAFNNKVLTSWSGSNIQSMNDATFSYIGGNAGYTIVSDFPDSTLIHHRIREAWGDGTTVTWDNYIIDNEGNVAKVSDFDNAIAGNAFREKLLNFNYEQVITSSLFGDRSIDLVVEPKVLIQSGLIQ